MRRDTACHRTSRHRDLPWRVLPLLALLVFTTPGILAGQGLKLKETETKVLDIFDRPNPHFALSCSDCHERRPVMGVDTAETVTFVSFDPSALPEEERRFVPDVLVEEDLDGDEIEDLLLCNRAYLEKYSARERTFLRILAGGIYIGQAKGHYQTLDDAVPSAEARTAILERARAIVLPEP